jgi:hypothetical protein
MNKKLKVALIAAGTVLTMGISIIFILSYGTLEYTRRCAHIADKQGIVCNVGDTIYLDDLAYFSNYDERMITGITDGEGVISNDGSNITITKADGFVTVYVHANNVNAPEHTEHEIKILVKDA